MAFGEAVGETGRFREAEAVAETEGPVGRGLKGDEVARRDVQRSDAGAGAEDEADDLAGIGEGETGAGFRGKGGMPAAEAALGDADGGNAGEEAEVAGDTEAAGVGVALAVDEEEIGPWGELFEGQGKGRDFSKGKEAGDVGKGDRAFDDALFDELEGRIGEDDGSGAGDTGAGGTPASTWTVDVGDIGCGYETNVPRTACENHIGGETPLEGDCRGRRDVPGVKSAQAHDCSIGASGKALEAPQKNAGGCLRQPPARTSRCGEPTITLRR